MPYEKELAVAREIAVAAGEIALRYQRQGVTAEAKSDQSPVTIADRECERLIVQHLAEAFPDDGQMGEEGAKRESRSGRRWIIDPIDGTRDFVRGNPRWAILLGLEGERDQILTGVAHFPASGETFYATPGGGAFRNGTRIHASGITNPAEAVICVNGLIAMERMPFAGRLIPWLSQFFAVRSLGGSPDAMLLAQGYADLWIEPTSQPWDLAPLKIIFQESGIRLFTFDGQDTIYGGHAFACVPALEPMFREFVSNSAT